MINKLRAANWKDKIRLYLAFPSRLWALKVAGHSMSPTINDGEVVLYGPTVNVEVGDIVFTPHPFMQSVKIVKRVAKINADGMLLLIGDNPAESTDSRTLGSFPIKSIQGRVVCRLK